MELDGMSIRHEGSFCSKEELLQETYIRRYSSQRRTRNC